MHKPKLFLQCLIHTSHTVSLEIHGYVSEAVFFEGFYDLLAVFQDFWELVREYFDSGQGAVDADAQLVEAKVQEKLLGFVYHAKLFFGDGLSVYKSGRQTGKGLFLPGWKAKIFGKGANVFFI